MKIALVTGGDKGIGYELCRNLAQAGRHVLIGARDRALGEKAVERLKQEGVGKVSVLEIDTTKQQTVTAAAQEIMLTVQLAWELRGTKVKVNSANPGFTKTDLNDNRGTQPVEVGAIAATRLALVEDDGPTGMAVSKNGRDPLGRSTYRP